MSPSKSSSTSSVATRGYHQRHHISSLMASDVGLSSLPPDISVWRRSRRRHQTSPSDVPKRSHRHHPRLHQRHQISLVTRLLGCRHHRWNHRYHFDHDHRHHHTIHVTILFYSHVASRHCARRQSRRRHWRHQWRQHQCHYPHHNWCLHVIIHIFELDMISSREYQYWAELQFIIVYIAELLLLRDKRFYMQLLSCN